MIEYMYSRIIVTIASVALVAVVVSASFGASEQAALHCAEQIADSICEAVEAASEVDADSYERRLDIDSGGPNRDLSVLIDGSRVEVDKGRYSIARSFHCTVNLMAGGSQVDCIVVVPGSAIVIRSLRGALDEGNQVTIETLPE